MSSGYISSYPSSRHCMIRRAEQSICSAIIMNSHFHLYLRILIPYLEVMHIPCFHVRPRSPRKMQVISGLTNGIPLLPAHPKPSVHFFKPDLPMHRKAPIRLFASHENTEAISILEHGVDAEDVGGPNVFLQPAIRIFITCCDDHISRIRSRNHFG